MRAGMAAGVPYGSRQPVLWSAPRQVHRPDTEQNGLQCGSGWWPCVFYSCVCWVGWGLSWVGTLRPWEVVLMGRQPGLDRMSQEWGEPVGCGLVEG